MPKHALPNMHFQLQSDLVNPTPMVLELFLVGLETAGLTNEACVNFQHGAGGADRFQPKGSRISVKSDHPWSD